jgi:hypothetical protein
VKVQLRKRDKGYDLVDNGAMQLTTLSGMDAADLLFQIKDELRRTDIGRRCVDAVAEQRRRERSAP